MAQCPFAQRLSSKPLDYQQLWNTCYWARDINVEDFDLSRIEDPVLKAQWIYFVALSRTLLPLFPWPFLASHDSDLMPYPLILLTCRHILFSPQPIRKPIGHDDQNLYRFTLNPYSLTATDNVPYCPHMMPYRAPCKFLLHHDYHLLRLVSPRRSTNDPGPSSFAFFQLGPLSYAPRPPCDIADIDTTTTPLDWRSTGFSLVLRVEIKFRPTPTSAHHQSNTPQRTPPLLAAYPRDLYAVYRHIKAPDPDKLCECGLKQCEPIADAPGRPPSPACSDSTVLVKSEREEEEEPFWATPLPDGEGDKDNNNNNNNNRFYAARVGDSDMLVEQTPPFEREIK
ncbi:hypothetical protein QBC41DRAFT_301966 [Cercophora samala]|uniref:Uncharacterized protein n=1 Tax=Cercophora samala TaxID=330535 RepID=A0AA40DB61_9PEZI|nr:hypothetical protein QBC41DRAFT_301966 [Cercophora samala]